MDALEISFSELLVVRAWRKLVFSRGACRLTGKELDCADASVIIDAIALFLKTLSGKSRHMLLVGHPGCVGVTSDERQMLSVIAAAQSEDGTLLLSHLSWLVRGDREDVEEAAYALARLLSAHGMRFPASPPQAFLKHRRLEVVRERSHA